MINKFCAFLLLSLIINAFFSSFVQGQNEMLQIKNFGSDPGNLEMYMHVPNNLNDSVKRPLIVALHGCTQDAASMAKQSGWNKLADNYGFFMLYPQQKFINNPNTCFNWFRKKDISKGKGEVKSIKQMIDYATKKYPIDSSKIFVYGLSSGAAMGVALLADYPELFNAGAILAGGPFMAATNPVSGLMSMVAIKNKSSRELAAPVLKQNMGFKNKYPRIIIIHGKNDPVVEIKNSYQLIQQWTYLHHTDTVADVAMPSFQKQADITKTFYKDADGDVVVIFYEVANLGHALMVNPGEGLSKGGETGLFAVDKDFFSTLWIAIDFGIIQ